MNRLRILWFFYLLLFLAVPRPASRGDATAGGASASAQERVTQIIQDLFGQFKIIPSAAATNSLAAYTNIEARFREASALLPHRLDLRFGIASALIGQALQTNASFNVKMKEAMAVYEEAHACDTNGVQAAILMAAYARAMGQTNASEQQMTRLLQIDPERTRAYVQRFRRIEEILQIQPSETVMPRGDLSSNHAIVILGAALETNGTMKPKLVDRLQQGLVLARLYPGSAAIVTGGNPRFGLTEAYLMGEWLLGQGITTNRIYLEDQARDTVGNAIRSCEILAKLGVSRATLVTSASHMRRALANFEEAASRRGLKITFDHLAAKDASPQDLARERVATFRDVLRTSGIWAYPAIQQ